MSVLRLVSEVCHCYRLIADYFQTPEKQGKNGRVARKQVCDNQNWREHLPQPLKKCLYLTVKNHGFLCFSSNCSLELLHGLLLSRPFKGPCAVPYLPVIFLLLKDPDRHSRHQKNTCFIIVFHDFSWFYNGLSRFFLWRKKLGRQFSIVFWANHDWQTNFVNHSCVIMYNHCIPSVIELDDGKIYRKALYLMVKTMVSCRFSLKPIHWQKYPHIPPSIWYAPLWIPHDYPV